MTAARVGVIGGSARAAVMSLARAGQPAWAVDLFGDRDLLPLAPTARCPFEEYPAALLKLAAPFPPGPFLYTGGLENEPAIIAELMARRPLMGNPPEVLARVRDVQWLHDVLHAANMPVPRVLSGDALVPPGERWLRKHPRSAGGLGVHPADDLQSDGYLQEFIPGSPMSALFASERDSLSLLGITEQLIGEPWLHAHGFQYCGNIGPVTVPEPLRRTLFTMGRLLHDQAGLQGVWGFDFIRNEGVPYLLEVNPRYTASMEVLEQAVQRNVFGPIQEFAAAPLRQVVGKAIAFAPRQLTFPDAGPWEATLACPFDPQVWPEFADIPTAGDVIDEGRPILSFFVTGHTVQECHAQLRARAAELDTMFDTTRTP